MITLVALGVLVLLLVLVGGVIIVAASRKNVTVVSLKPPLRESNPSLPSKSARKPAHTAPPGSLIRGVADAEIEAQIRSGHLIDAIKLYREKNGVGLKEAKDAVEAWRDRMRAS